VNRADIGSVASEEVFVGVDVHRKSYSVCALRQGVVALKATVPAKPGKLVELLCKRFPGQRVRTVYEAGFSGFVLHRVLDAAGIASIVVDPASVEIAVNDRVKTDMRDSRRLAALLACGRLRGIRIPTVAEETSRLIVRTRQQMVSARTRAGVQFKSRLHQFGLIAVEDSRRVSDVFMQEKIAAVAEGPLRLSLEALYRSWLHFHGEVSRYDALLRSKKEQGVEEKVYRQLPGVGPVTARMLATELGDLRRFGNERALFSFVGLTPTEYSSGESVRRGHISRRGSPMIRWLVVEAAWRAIRVDKALSNFFMRVAQTAGKKRAIVAVARKMLGKIRVCFRLEIPYEKDFGVAV